MNNAELGNPGSSSQGKGWPTTIPGLGVVLALDLPPHTVPFERFKQAVWAWHRKILGGMAIACTAYTLVTEFVVRLDPARHRDWVLAFSVILGYYALVAAIELLWAVHWVQRRGDLEIQSGTVSPLEVEWVNGRGKFRRHGLRQGGLPFEYGGIVTIRFRLWVPMRYEMLVIDLDSLPSDESREVLRKIVRLKPPKSRPAGATLGRTTP